MYCPSVRMMPFGPAPYLKMLTVPALGVRPAHHGTTASAEVPAAARRGKRGFTEDEADDGADSCEGERSAGCLSVVLGRAQGGTYCRPSGRPS
jgi:hypothetical protein